MQKKAISAEQPQIVIVTSSSNSHESPRIRENVRNQRELDIREEPRVTPRAQFEVENNASAENSKY